MARLDGRTALITGASRGIGRAIAEAFAREGADVVVNYAANRAAAQAVVRSVTSAGARAVALQADTQDSGAVRSLFDAAEQAFGGLDIVVLNAHPGLGHGALTELGDAEIDQQLAVLRGYVVALQEAGRRVRDGGVILCISSSATRNADARVGLYAAIKLSLEQMGRALSRELAPRRVRVMSIAPGLTRTDRLGDLDFGDRPIAAPETAAQAALFLASDAASWINTSTLYVNGGAVYAQ